MSTDSTPDTGTTAAERVDRGLDWPGDPEGVTPADIDFEALAHVLANTCRFGGCCAHYHSLAGHALVVSEEIEALDGLGEEDRRRLALHALLAPAPAAWLRGEPESQRGVERANRLAAGIERAVREAAGLDAALDDEGAELLRFVARMTLAAERRDLFGGGSAGAGSHAPLAGVAFPPLKRRIRPVGPGRAAAQWLARFRTLGRPPREDGAGAAGREPGGGEEPDGAGAGAGGDPHAGDGRETGDVAHLPPAERPGARAPRGRGKDARRAA